MTIVHRHNESKERAIIVMDDMTGVVIHVIVKRDEDELFVKGKNEEKIHDMIDMKLFKDIVMHERIAQPMWTIDAAFDLICKHLESNRN